MFVAHDPGVYASLGPPATFLKPSGLKKVLQLLRSKLAIDLIKRTFHTSSAPVKYVCIDHSCTYIFMS